MLFVELPDVEKENLVCEEGDSLEYIGLLRKCMNDFVDASARWHVHHVQIFKYHEFVHGPSSSFFFSCML